MRNNSFDARDSFIDEFDHSQAPFRQNEFGGTVGGPVVLPKLYNGRNHTFFFFAYEGWRYTQAENARYVVPTAEELQGNFSDSILNQPLYDPTSTVPDPNNPGEYLRTQFKDNIIPGDQVDSKVVNFLKAYDGPANLMGDPVHNAIVRTPNINNSGQYDGRADEQIGSKDNFFFAWSQLDISTRSPQTAVKPAPCPRRPSPSGGDGTICSLQL